MFNLLNVSFQHTTQTLAASRERRHMSYAGRPCHGKETFCENVDTYPIDRIRDAVKSTDKFNAFFGEDIIDPPQTTMTMNRNSFDVQSSSIKIDLCVARKYLKFPLAAENTYGTWHYIVNDNNNNSTIKQGVQVEICE